MRELVNTIFAQVKDHLNGSKRFIITIDGPACSLKSCLAAKLASMIDGEVIHMDEFFLEPTQRTKERFLTPGGNINYERFKEEIIAHLDLEKFSYRVFSCQVMDYCEKKEITGFRPLIVEGSYSNHPFFGEYADFKVFLKVSDEVQKERIIGRDGIEMLKRFQDEWLVYEQLYFDTFRIEEKSDLVLETDYASR